MPEAMKYSGNGMIQKIKSHTEPLIPGKKLLRDFFIRDVLEVAPEMVGKNLVVILPDGSIGRYMVTEVEAYRGNDDKACHAFKGRTSRTEIMFHQGGHLYIYLIYGMYWMLNVVTGLADVPQAVLIRGVGVFDGPGKLTKSLGIDNSYYGLDLVQSDRIWLEDTGVRTDFKTGQRIGIEYAGEYWSSRPWRFYI